MMYPNLNARQIVNAIGAKDTRILPVFVDNLKTKSVVQNKTNSERNVNEASLCKHMGFSN